MELKEKQMMNSCWADGKSICNLSNLVERKHKEVVHEGKKSCKFFETHDHGLGIQKNVPANEMGKRKATCKENILRNEEHGKSLHENYKQPAGKESRLKHQNNYPKRTLQRSHFFHRLTSLTNIKDMLILSVLLLSTLTAVEASVTVNQTEIVVKKGEEVELVCTSSKSEALGCSFKSPAEHNYNMLRGAAYEEGRIQQKELNPNDCAMKITNIRQSDNGIWKCNVTARDSNGEYDIGTGNINLVVAIAPVEVSMKIDNKFITGE